VFPSTHASLGPWVKQKQKLNTHTELAHSRQYPGSGFQGLSLHRPVWCSCVATLSTSASPVPLTPPPCSFLRPVANSSPCYVHSKNEEQRWHCCHIFPFFFKSTLLKALLLSFPQQVEPTKLYLWKKRCPQYCQTAGDLLGNAHLWVSVSTAPTLIWRVWTCITKSAFLFMVSTIIFIPWFKRFWFNSFINRLHKMCNIYKHSS